VLMWSSLLCLTASATVAPHLGSVLGSCCTISFELLSLGNPFFFIVVAW
jgi:hypothetical protein